MSDLLSRAGAIREVAHALDYVPDSDAVVATLVRSCEELTGGGSATAALKLLELAESIRGPITDAWRIRFEITRAIALRITGDYEKSLRLCRSTLANDAHHLVHLREQYVQLRIAEGAALWQLNACDEAVERLTEIRQTLLGEPDSRLLALCTLELSSALLFNGSLDAARALALDSLVSSRRCGARAIEGFALENLSRMDKYFCRWSSAEEMSRAALAIFEGLGHPIALLISQIALSIILWKRGRLVEAEKWAEASLAAAAAHDSKPHLKYAPLLMANIHIHAGRYEKAQVLLGSEVKYPLPQDRAGILREELLGELFIELGSYERAMARFDAVEPAAMSMAPRGDIACELPRRRAEAFLGLGEPEEARTLALVGLDKCRLRKDRYEEAAVYRTLALSAAALGKPDEARQWFQQGFAYYDDIETPYEWGKLWMAYGDWLRGPNAGEYSDKTGALEAYRAAKEHFEQMGAMGKLAEVQARITECIPQVPAAPEPATSAGMVDLLRPRRRPRGSGELERRSTWAKETFGFITRSKVVLDLLGDVAKLARSHSPVLVLGESGTGKELVAAGIHRLSNRTGNYMPVNCGALPREVIESELFGHTAGAFTGATRDKMGLFESCNAGTVFLDEVAEMSLDLQSKLLRFLETGEFRRVGSTKNVGVDVLVIAATNRERDALESGEGFRSDLYYRLAHAVITIPPLRRRGEDIDLLISHFLEDACTRHGKQVVLSTAARNRLIAHSWPGNVRQLRSTINRLVVLNEPGVEIAPEALELPAAEAPANLMEELGQAERRRIVEALAQAAGVRTEAAKTLGMSRTTLIGKMKRFGIQ